jgi:hypothetical protein
VNGIVGIVQDILVGRIIHKKSILRSGTPASQAQGISKQMRNALQEKWPVFIARVCIGGHITPILSKPREILAKLWRMRQNSGEVPLEIINIHASLEDHIEIGRAQKQELPQLLPHSSMHGVDLLLPDDTKESG